jgi:hypothetical protein
MVANARRTRELAEEALAKLSAQDQQRVRELRGRS